MLPFFPAVPNRCLTPKPGLQGFVPVLPEGSPEGRGEYK
jgi:hypothetical protein